MVRYVLTFPPLGQDSPYRDNAGNVFGVQDVGLPDGCQVEQAHTLQRHADRLPGDWSDDGPNSERFAEKVANHTKDASERFTGQLEFLNSWKYQLGVEYLTGIGATTEFKSGVSFWNQYGRILYNATQGQLQYNATYGNGTLRQKPVLRTTSQSRMQNSQINWALGFFGNSYYMTPDPYLGYCTDGSLFDVIVIPEGDNLNNTLASYDACFADQVYGIGDIGDNDRIAHYTPLYLAGATKRLQQYAPEGFEFTVNDTYAMQATCAYETAYISSSDLCGLFTEDEWAGFEHAQGIGYYCKRNSREFVPIITDTFDRRLRLRKPHRPRPGPRILARTARPTQKPIHYSQQQQRQQHPYKQRRRLPSQPPLLRRLHPRRHHHLRPGRHERRLLSRSPKPHRLSTGPQEALENVQDHALRRQTHYRSHRLCGLGPNRRTRAQDAILPDAVRLRPLERAAQVRPHALERWHRAS